MKVEVWMVVEATRSQMSRYPAGHPYAGQFRVNGMKAKALYQNKPSVAANQQAVKIELDMDDGWFLDNGAPTAHIVVPAPDPADNAVAVTVDMPIKPRGKSAAANIVRH